MVYECIYTVDDSYLLSNFCCFIVSNYAILYRFRRLTFFSKTFVYNIVAYVFFKET